MASTQESALVSNRRQGGLSSSIENIPTISPRLRCGRSYYALGMASCSQFVSHALCGIALIHQIHCVQWSKMVMGLRNNLLPTQVLWLVMGLRNTCQGNSFIQESRRSLVSKSWLTRGLSCTTKILFLRNNLCYYNIISCLIDSRAQRKKILDTFSSFLH